MKIKLFIALLLLPVFALGQDASDTDIMGGGTPGREDKNRTSKLMYNYEKEEEGLIQNDKWKKEKQEDQEEKPNLKKKGTKE